MQYGITVPSCKPETCIDMMIDFCQHLHDYEAPGGYLKTGLGVSLDGSEDHLVLLRHTQ